MTNYSLFGALVITSALVISGCDSSSNGSEDNNDTQSSNSVSSSMDSSSSSLGTSSSSISSINSSSSSSQGSVTYTCTDTFNQTGGYMKVESGTQGDITYDCKILSASNGYNLTVPAITITNVKKVETLVGSFDGKTVNGTTTYDFKSGTVHYEGTFAGENINCTDIYLTSLPADFYRGVEEDLENLLDDWGNGDDYISSDCPSDIDDFEPNTVDVVDTTDITVTDDQSGEHKISIRLTIQY